MSSSVLTLTVDAPNFAGFSQIRPEEGRTCTTREAYGSLGVGVDSIEKLPRVEDRQRGLQGSQPAGHCKVQGWDNPSHPEEVVDELGVLAGSPFVGSSFRKLSDSRICGEEDVGVAGIIVSDENGACVQNGL